MMKKAYKIIPVIALIALVLIFTISDPRKNL